MYFFFFQAEDGIRDVAVTGVQTCALPICAAPAFASVKVNGSALVASETQLLKSAEPWTIDRKSTRLNSSHGYISYAVFCLKKKKKNYVAVEILQSILLSVRLNMLRLRVYY